MWPSPQFPADLVTFTDEILMESVFYWLKNLELSVYISVHLSNS